MLFDPGATHSFVSPYYATKLNKGKMIMENPLAISTPLGEMLEVNYMYRSCEIVIGDRILYADLIELPILEFDVILGMEWLSANYATMDCYRKKITSNHWEYLSLFSREIIMEALVPIFQL